MNSTHLFAVKRALQDVKELEGIAGVDIAKSDDPLTINLDYSPAGLATTEDSKFHFCIRIPLKYPFRPPSFKWICRPQGPAGHSQFLGPTGDVSVSALSQWTPASSLANVLISLFPSKPLAAQCCRATSHLWLMEEGKAIFPTAVTDPCVLHCLAEHLLAHEPKSAHALHLTCRAAASAVQQAVSKLGVVGQPVDIVHAVEAFSGLTQLQCTQCALTCQSVLQLDPSLELMSSLTSLAIIRCTSKPLFGPTGLFAALKALPHLEELEFEPATGMLWAVYDNTGSTEFAGNPFGTEGVLNLPPEIPRPVPDDCSSIWTALGSITQLRSLSVAVPLFAMAYAHRDLGWHGWSAASRIADLAFSARGLAAMPRLESLSLDLQHGMMRTVRPDEGMVPAAQRQVVLDSYCGWQLPECRLKSFSLSGVGLGSRQLNYQKSTQEFWGSLEQLTIGHSIVADALQATAHKTLAGLACNVAYPNLAPLEDAPPRPGHSAEPPLVSWWEGLMQDRP